MIPIHLLNYLKMINNAPQVMWMAWLWPYHSFKHRHCSCQDCHEIYLSTTAAEHMVRRRIYPKVWDDLDPTWRPLPRIGWSENLHPDIPYVDATLHDPGLFLCGATATRHVCGIYIYTLNIWHCLAMAMPLNDSTWYHIILYDMPIQTF